MKIKQYLVMISVIAILVTLALNFGGCGSENYSEKKGIYTLGIDAATGNKENSNHLVLVNDYGSPSGPYSKSNYSLMTGETAQKFIQEINSLPDVFGNEEDPFAYNIHVRYYDDDQNLIEVEKTGYGDFPDNWGMIVSYANEITVNRQKKLTDSTDLVVVDADLLRSEFGVTDDMLPEDVTVERFLEDTGLNYVDLYSSYCKPETRIRQYTYDYYDLGSRRITKENTASASDTTSLSEYADANLENINSANGICINGLFEGYEFDIVRFDRFEEWKANTGVDGDSKGYFDDTLDIYYTRDAGCEGMTYNETHYVYVEPSNRFLIITQCTDYAVINDYFAR